jgi:hypothetical protein
MLVLDRYERNILNAIERSGFDTSLPFTAKQVEKHLLGTQCNNSTTTLSRVPNCHKMNRIFKKAKTEYELISGWEANTSGLHSGKSKNLWRRVQ